MKFPDQDLDPCIGWRWKAAATADFFSRHIAAHVLSHSYKGFFSRVLPRLDFQSAVPDTIPHLPITATALLKMYK